MLKHKKFLSLLLVLPLFTSFSCTKVNEPHTVIKSGDKNNLLEVVTMPDKWKQPIEAPFELTFEGLVVTFNGNNLDTVAKNIEDARGVTTYFICTSDVAPSKSIISNFEVKWTNTQVNTQLNFYIAHLDVDNNAIHLSNKVTINVTNKGAFAGPWVVPVITIGIGLIVVAMIFFTHRYKAKKEGK